MVPQSYRWEMPLSDADQAERLGRQIGVSSLIARLLITRGIDTAEKADKYLHGSANDMYSPFLMKGMHEAVERLLEALEKHEKVTIYGDYDVDGMTATSILYLYFKEIGLDADYYLPDRMTEGYGLNADAVREIAGRGTQLIISVDTGITAVNECRLIKELGMEIIVTDHHECLDQLPEAVCLVDAKQPGETYPYRYLAGCGVAYKVVSALEERLGHVHEIRSYLELAAVGTVADIVPLTDENRLIVAEGFRRMKNPANYGLKKLLEIAGYDFRNDMTGGRISFQVAPRLNAGGRMGDAKRGVRLFTTEDRAEADAIARELSQENAERQETEALILEQVVDKIENTPEIEDSLIMVVDGDGWHHGVIGIVSSRIKEKYYRPNILLSVEDGIAKGSARSIDGFNLFEALKSCGDLMIKYGGHAAAAGMTLKAENIPELRRRLNAYAREHMTTDMLIPQIRPELIIEPQELTVDLIRMMSAIEPCGQDMPKPIIALKGQCSEIRQVGQDTKSLRLVLKGDYRRVAMIGFRMPDTALYYQAGQELLAAGQPSLNEYRGEVYPQLIVSDVRKELSADVERLVWLYSLRRITGSFADLADQMPKVSKRTFTMVYLFLKQHGQRHMGSDEMAHLLITDTPAFTMGSRADQIYVLLSSLCVLEELGLIRVQAKGNYLSYELITGINRSLVDSAWYRSYMTE